MSPDCHHASITPEHGADLFGSDAKRPVREAIGKSLIQEPLAPMANAVALTTDKFGTVAKFCMETTREVIVSLALQERMIEGAGVKRVFKINAGQASYITQPHAVAQAICGGGATKRAIHWRLSERYLAIWRMCEIPVLPRMRGQGYA